MLICLSGGLLPCSADFVFLLVLSSDPVAYVCHYNTCGLETLKREREGGWGDPMLILWKNIKFFELYEFFIK